MCNKSLIIYCLTEIQFIFLASSTATKGTIDSPKPMIVSVGVKIDS